MGLRPNPQLTILCILWLSATSIYLSGCGGIQPQVTAQPATNTPEPTAITTPKPVIVFTTGPILLPTSNPTPLETILDLKFEAQDGQVLDGRFYPPSVCPAALMIVYFPWEQGDLNDWDIIARYFSGKIPYGVFSFTPRGCQEGCTKWDRAGWRLDYQAAMGAFSRLPCASPSPVVTIGSSAGEDAAFFACGLDDNCVGTVAFSPGGWIGIPYENEVQTLVSQKKHTWVVVSQDDPKTLRLNHPEWRDYYREIVVQGDKHGNELYNNYTLGVVLNILRIELECASYSELSCPLPTETP